MSTQIKQKAASDRQWSLVQLKDRCRRVRNGVRVRNLATEEELQALYPGDDASYNAHIHYYAGLWRIYEREKYVTHGSEYATRHLLKALDSEPQAVELVSGDTVQAYPKSYDALLWFRDEYFWLNWHNVRHEAIYEQADQYEALKEADQEPLRGVERPVSATEEILIEIGRRSARILWAACHEGPALPWPYCERAPEEAPGEWRDLHPIDVRRIETAFYEVNVGRLSFLPKPKDRRGQGIAPEVFFAMRAKQTGLPVSELRRGRALAQDIAQVSLQGHSEDAA